MPEKITIDLNLLKVEPCTTGYFYDDDFDLKLYYNDEYIGEIKWVAKVSVAEIISRAAKKLGAI